MKYAADDIAALRSVDVARAYAERVLGAPKREGAAWLYPCPFHSHSRPKLRIDAAADGAGVAVCKVDGVQGDVFTLAAAVLGLDARRDFAVCVEEVAEKTGYTLRPVGDAAAARKGTRRRAAKGFPLHTPSQKVQAAPQEAASVAAAAPLEYLPADDERAALQAVERAAAAPAAMARHADALGLPADAVQVHTDPREAAALGLLGLDERGRLLYVYTHREGQAVRVLMVKRRSLPEEVAGGAPRFLCRGCKQALYGADALPSSCSVFITEGESDALAVRAAFWAFLDGWAHDSPADFPAPDNVPLVVGKPDAGTFKPTWADAMHGKDVTLIADADDAGRAGAEKTAAVLRAAGACRVFVWVPAGGCKDARAALDAARPWLLAEDILLNRKELKQ